MICAISAFNVIKRWLEEEMREPSDCFGGFNAKKFERNARNRGAKPLETKVNVTPGRVILDFYWRLFWFARLRELIGLPVFMSALPFATLICN